MLLPISGDSCMTHPHHVRRGGGGNGKRGDAGPKFLVLHITSWNYCAGPADCSKTVSRNVTTQQTRPAYTIPRQAALNATHLFEGVTLSSCSRAFCTTNWYPTGSWMVEIGFNKASGRRSASRITRDSREEECSVEEQDNEDFCLVIKLQAASTTTEKPKRHDKVAALLGDHVLSTTPSLLPPLSFIAPSSQSDHAWQQFSHSINNSCGHSVELSSLMGIPGLTLRLINRGHWITMEPEQDLCQTNPESLNPSQGNQQRIYRSVAILDGPGLAYHICQQYRADNLANSLTELNPSYSDIGARAVQFLEDMEAVGLKIHAVYFDGVLPSTKLATRKQRLQKTMKHLDEAKESFKTGKALGKNTPDPPFLVPSVLESIKNSRFGDVLAVVPAEADVYCATEAMAYEMSTGMPATIITNDSDLLIQASGAQTRVLLLSSITRSRAPNPPRVEGNFFFPARLATAAGVDNLVQTAFFMSQDYHLSFDAAVAKAKKTSLGDDADFLAFQSELEKPDYSTSGFKDKVIKTLEQMDPRIAELAHQTMPGFPHAPNESANMFLVPLLEDVGRFSAWASGQDIRDATYRMILSSSRNVRGVDEYIRRGTNCAPEPHPPAPDWKADLLRISQMLADVKAFLEPHHATAAQRFNYIAMYYTIKAMATRGSHMLTQQEVSRVLAKDRLRSKGEVHASAMCQAAIYSLRMLKQLLALEKAKGGMAKELKALNKALGEMPTLAELFEKTAADTTVFWSELAEGLLGTIDDE